MAFAIAFIGMIAIAAGISLLPGTPTTPPPPASVSAPAPPAVPPAQR